MTDPRVMRLLEEILESGQTPEEACVDSPELLWEVRERLQRCREVDVEIDAMFPPSGQNARAASSVAPGAVSQLPNMPGYDVESVLGRGGMGVVYKARHVKLGRPVALKMIIGGTFASASDRSRFTHEAQSLASLHHPNIVQVYDVAELNGLPYFTMEYVEGGSLGEKLAGTPQPAPEAADLVATLASAVQAAHDAGIVHRDLKPGNVLLAADGTPKITDFGLARHFGQDETLTLSGVRVGTPSYMSPEQAAGKSAAVGPAADVYSLGAMLYELLTGRPPFRAESPTATVLQVMHQDPAPPSRLNGKVPRDLETVCLKCLQKDPRRRYASAAALGDDLRRFLGARPILARPLGWGGRMLRWARREPAGAALVATALAMIALAVGGGFLVLRQRAATRASDALSRQAAEAALSHAQDLQKLGHWPEARAALEVAPTLVGNSAPPALRERLRRARADANMVVRLEGVRLRLSEGTGVQGRVSPAADQLYAEAFRSYGINVATLEAAEAAARIRESAIRDILLEYLHDWLYWVVDSNRDTLRAAVEAADDDPWRRAYRDAREHHDISRMEELARAPEAVTQPSAILSGLGGMLLADGHRDDARTLLSAAQQRHPADFWINYLFALFSEREHPQEAVGYARAAVAVRPGSDQAYALLGRTLRAAGDADGAIAALNENVALNRTRAGIAELAKALAPRGRLEEARSLWEKMLARDPPDHESWYGYAQLCLYLGKDEEYRRTREAMLRRFGESDDWIVAERTSLASLLTPATGDTLRRAAALADRAVAAAKSREPDNAYVQLVKGLAEFRSGRVAQAIPLLRDSAARLPNRPTPRLVLAMAEFQSGSPEAARRSLAAAVVAYNWKESYDDHATLWGSHVLRREAEAMILPDLPSFLQGTYQPRDNDERLALLGVCQAGGLYGAAARLYADAFAADPVLPAALTAGCFERAAREGEPQNRLEVLKSAPRFAAASCAALAGRGIGKDAARLNSAERTRLRTQARDWLLADLAAVHNMPQSAPAVAKAMMALWLAEPDLATLREAEEMKDLPAQEREEWNDFWTQVRLGLREAPPARDG